jgi:hypothetical protein
VYGRNNPVRFIDPNGERGFDVGIVNPMSESAPFMSSEDEFVLLDSGVVLAQSGRGFSGIGCKRDVHRPTREGYRINGKAELRCHSDKPGRSIAALAETCLDGRETSQDGWFALTCNVDVTQGVVPLSRAYRVVLEFDLSVPCENQGRYRTKMYGGRLSSPQMGSKSFGSEKSGAIGPYRDCGSTLRRPDVPDDDDPGNDGLI